MREVQGRRLLVSPVQVSRRHSCKNSWLIQISLIFNIIIIARTLNLAVYIENNMKGNSKLYS